MPDDLRPVCSSGDPANGATLRPKQMLTAGAEQAAEKIRKSLRSARLASQTSPSEPKSPRAKGRRTGAHDKPKAVHEPSTEATRKEATKNKDEAQHQNRTAIASSPTRMATRRSTRESSGIVQPDTTVNEGNVQSQDPVIRTDTTKADTGNNVAEEHVDAAQDGANGQDQVPLPDNEVDTGLARTMTDGSPPSQPGEFSFVIHVCTAVECGPGHI